MAKPRAPAQRPEILIWPMTSIPAHPPCTLLLLMNKHVHALHDPYRGCRERGKLASDAIEAISKLSTTSGAQHCQRICSFCATA